MNGYYKFMLKNKYETNMYFYSNGMVNYLFTNWGHFAVRNDSIVIQLYHSTQHQSFLKEYLTEYNGVIINDTTIQLIGEKCLQYYCDLSKKSIIYPEPKVFNFEKNAYKPDSSTAWFCEKKWYQEGLKQNIN